MSSLPSTSALLVIDVQKGFHDAFWGSDRNHPEAEANIARLLAGWRGSGRPVWFIQHASRNPASPLHPGNPGYAIQDEVAPLAGEPVVVKEVNSAFIGTGLEQRLRQAGIGHLVVVGLTTNYCVSTTVRMAANLGFETCIVSDATATFGRRGPDGAWHSAETLHTVGLAELHGEFATVLTTDEVLARLQAGSGNGERPAAETASAPAPQHRSWAELPLEAMSGMIDRQFVAGQQILLARLLLKKGAIVPMHSHRHEQITYVAEGALRFTIDGGERVVRAGEVLVIPPHMPHAAEALEDTLDFDVFHPLREDWLTGRDQYLRQGGAARPDDQQP